MKFELNFDKKLFRKQVESSFSTNWKKYVYETKRVGILSIFFILFAGIIFYGKGKDTGTIFSIIAFFMAISFFVRRNKYKNAKIETEKIINDYIKLWEKNPISKWEFEDEYFRLDFYGGDYKIYWENFKYYDIIDDTLFFGFKKDDNYYTLSESEVGKENFLKIVDFIKTKIKISE